MMKKSPLLLVLLLLAVQPAVVAGVDHPSPQSFLWPGKAADPPAPEAGALPGPVIRLAKA